jgi:hypothetical protein
LFNGLHTVVPSFLILPNKQSGTLKFMAGLREVPSRHLPEAPYYRVLRHHRNNRKSCASNLRFPHAKQFLRKLPAISVRGYKNVRRPSSRTKKYLKIFSLKSNKLLARRGANMSLVTTTHHYHKILKLRYFL